MKHQLIVLVGGVERVCACGVSCNTRKDRAGQAGSQALIQKAIVLDEQMM